MGALLKDKDGEFELVATDGHRLALVNFPKPEKKAKLPNVLIPKKALAEILKMDGGGGRHAFDPPLRKPPALHDRQPAADRASARRQFPDYEKILSKGNDRVALASRTAVQSAIRRVSLFAPERARGVKLSFEKNSLTVTSASQELGEGTETLDIAFDAEPLALGLNAQYLLDFLDEAETEKIRLELKDENTQCLCSPEGGIEGASRYVYVVMPMRL